MAKLNNTNKTWRLNPISTLLATLLQSLKLHYKIIITATNSREPQFKVVTIILKVKMGHTPHPINISLQIRSLLKSNVILVKYLAQARWLSYHLQHNIKEMTHILSNRKVNNSKFKLQTTAHLINKQVQISLKTPPLTPMNSTITKPTKSCS